MHRLICWMRHYSHQPVWRRVLCLLNAADRHYSHQPVWRRVLCLLNAADRHYSHQPVWRRVLCPTIVDIRYSCILLNWTKTVHIISTAWYHPGQMGGQTVTSVIILRIRTVQYTEAEMAFKNYYTANQWYENGKLDLRFDQVKVNPKLQWPPMAGNNVLPKI